MTNFATFIDSGNDRAPIAQRGHAKQKRNDLRIVGLGLVVSTDGGVPLVSHAYPGNLPDVTQFEVMVRELTRRFSVIGGSISELTLVFDAGQNSADNFELFSDSPLHFVGSLPPSDHPELCAVSKRRYRAVEGFPGLRAFETRTVVFGVSRRVIVTHSPNLHDKQQRGFTQTLAKASRQLCELEARLGRGRTRKSRQAVEAEIADIVKPRWVDRVISTTLTGEAPPDLSLSWHVEPTAFKALKDELFGKRILVTDKEESPVAQVVRDYRSQEIAEGDFRQMKDRKVVSFSPMFHFTEQKIRVHVFYCVLALAVARLMVREAERHAMDLSVRSLLDTLGEIEETVLLYQGERGRPRARRMLTEMSPTARRLFDLFGLKTYAPPSL
jgi:transposase